MVGQQAVVYAGVSYITDVSKKVCFQCLRPRQIF